MNQRFRHFLFKWFGINWWEQLGYTGEIQQLYFSGAAGCKFVYIIDNQEYEFEAPIESWQYVSRYLADDADDFAWVHLADVAINEFEEYHDGRKHEYPLVMFIDTGTSVRKRFTVEQEMEPSYDCTLEREF